MPRPKPIQRMQFSGNQLSPPFSWHIDENRPIPETADGMQREVWSMIGAMDFLQWEIALHDRDAINVGEFRFSDDALFALMVKIPRVRSILDLWGKDIRNAHRPNVPQLWGRGESCYTQAALRMAVERLQFLWGFSDADDTPRAAGMGHYEYCRLRSKEIVKNSAAALALWTFPRVDFPELQSLVFLEWSWLDGMALAKGPPGDLLKELTPIESQIISFLWDGKTPTRKEFQREIWRDMPATDDRDRQAVNRLNRKLVGGDLDSFKLEVEYKTHVRLARRP